MHAPLGEQHHWYSSVLRGHYGYFGMPHNWRSLNGAGSPALLVQLPQATKPKGPAHRLGLVRGFHCTLAAANPSDHAPLDTASGTMRVTSEKSSVRESRMPGSVRAKPNGRAIRPRPGVVVEHAQIRAIGNNLSIRRCTATPATAKDQKYLRRSGSIVPNTGFAQRGAVTLPSSSLNRSGGFREARCLLELTCELPCNNGRISTCHVMHCRGANANRCLEHTPLPRLIQPSD